jgi:hypothetical protein
MIATQTNAKDFAGLILFTYRLECPTAEDGRSWIGSGLNGGAGLDCFGSGAGKGD